MENVAEIAEGTSETEPTSTEIVQDRPEVSEPTETYKPFANGKEKFTINGQDEELDWETAKRYVQFGKAGRAAMDKAAKLESSYKKTYAQLAEAAARMENGDFSLYTALTGKQYIPKTQQGPAKSPNSSEVPERADPRDQELQSIREELNQFKAEREKIAVENERKAVESELDAAVKKFPTLDDKFSRAFVKSEYRKALMNGEDLSLEDVAFFVAEEKKTQDAAKSKATQQRIEQNIHKSPVIAPHANAPSKKKGTLEDSLKLGGLMPS